MARVPGPQVTADQPSRAGAARAPTEAQSASEGGQLLASANCPAPPLPHLNTSDMGDSYNPTRNNLINSIFFLFNDETKNAMSSRCAGTWQSPCPTSPPPLLSSACPRPEPSSSAPRRERPARGTVFDTRRIYVVSFCP